MPISQQLATQFIHKSTELAIHVLKIDTDLHCGYGPIINYLILTDATWYD